MRSREAGWWGEMRQRRKGSEYKVQEVHEKAAVCGYRAYSHEGPLGDCIEHASENWEVVVFVPLSVIG